MQRPPDATVTIFWDWVTTARIMDKHPTKQQRPYIQPAPYRTDETVKSDLNSLMVQVDDT